MKQVWVTKKHGVILWDTRASNYWDMMKKLQAKLRKE